MKSGTFSAQQAAWATAVLGRARRTRHFGHLARQRRLRPARLFAGHGGLRGRGVGHVPAVLCCGSLHDAHCAYGGHTLAACFSFLVFCGVVNSRVSSTDRRQAPAPRPRDRTTLRSVMAAADLLAPSGARQSSLPGCGSCSKHVSWMGRREKLARAS